MTRTWTITAVAGACLAAALSVPAVAAEGNYRYESCYSRDQYATGSGVVAGAIVGGAFGGPAGAILGGAIGGAAGDDSVDCRYERYEGADYDGGNRYRRDGPYTEGTVDRDGYRQGYTDRSGNDHRLNGLDRGYHVDSYTYRRSTYREGNYDRYGVWHADRASRGRGFRPN
ncbi:hypothetical protein [Asticcacaulis sp. AC402]|uniref:hypothetical protein n=1 Tax=Asticcacaulis sp. AC402 TaxID=1282361 RepID=UPI0003C3DB8F|nr:hypothetical protein [Asticcacaulis sp. AC402]ESQ75366.1 hypothetical protein ABAC402_09690 [Asticcacaulis sp. AC402]